MSAPPLGIGVIWYPVYLGTGQQHLPTCDGVGGAGQQVYFSLEAVGVQAGGAAVLAGKALLLSCLLLGTLACGVQHTQLTDGETEAQQLNI